MGRSAWIGHAGICTNEGLLVSRKISSVIKQTNPKQVSSPAPPSQITRREMMASEHLGHETTDTHLLTSIRWNSMPEFGGSGSVETGIRKLSDGQIVQGSFRLIQHGWHRYEEAHAFIKKALAKGWDVYRIDRAMQFLKERGK